jgi:hypothetical protein
MTDSEEINSYTGNAVKSAKIFKDRCSYDLEAMAVCLQAELHLKFNQLLLDNQKD